MGKVNVTPMIDVVMVLIVFYLIVGKLAADREVAMDLPTARMAGEVSEDRLIVVNVAPRDGRARIIVGRETLDERGLAELVRTRVASDPASVVEVRADRSVAFGSVRPVLDACRSAGVGELRLAVVEGG